MKRKALGKGLAALLPEEPSRDPDGTLLEVDPERIDPNPDQPRQRFDEAKIAELAQSMIEQGVVQPLVVLKRGSRFQLIAGERRWRAARRAKLAKVPVVVREADERQVLELALVENIQREELNPIEEAAAYRRLVSELGYSQEQVATRVGKDRSTVANLLRLLRLPKDVRELIASGQLSSGHARPLLGLDDPTEQLAIAREAMDGKLSVRDVERKVKSSKASPRTAAASKSDPNTKEAERRLEEILGTVVKIRRRKKGQGRLEIDFHSEEELHRIYETIQRGTRNAKRPTR